MSKKIIYTRSFLRHYKERIAKNPLLRQAYIDSVEAFIQNPTSVRVHPLKRKMLNKFSFEVTRDYRVTFRENEDSFTFLDVGKHDEVYEEPFKK